MENKTIDNCLNCEYILNCDIYQTEVNQALKGKGFIQYRMVIEDIQKRLGSSCLLAEPKIDYNIYNKVKQ